MGEDTRKPSAALRPTTAAARLVPAVLAGSGDGRGGLALSKSTRRSAESLSVEPGWTVFLNGPPRSPLPPSASLATDHSGHAGAPRTASARSGLKCMCPRRQRFSRFGPGLPGASGTRRPTTDLVASWAKRGMRWPLAPGGSARGAGWAAASGALSLAPQRGARRRERERTDESVGRSPSRKSAMS